MICEIIIINIKLNQLDFYSFYNIQIIKSGSHRNFYMTDPPT